MSATTFTHTSFVEKMCGSVFGAIIGCICFILMFPLIYWNEQNAVCQNELFKKMEDNTLELGKSLAQCIYTGESAGKINAATCAADFFVADADGVDDPLFQSPAQGFWNTAAQNDVFSIQTSTTVMWPSETCSTQSSDDSVGGGTSSATTCTVNTPSYTSSPQALSSFKNNFGGAAASLDLSTIKIHNDNNQKPFSAAGNPTRTIPATPVDLSLGVDQSVGSDAASRFKLLGSMTSAIDYVSVSMTTGQITLVSAASESFSGGCIVSTQHQGQVTTTGGACASGCNIGATKTCFAVKRLPSQLSILGLVEAASTGGQFGTYSDELGILCPTKTQSPYLSNGNALTAADMYKILRDQLEALTWVLRILAFFGMWISLNMITQPVTTAPDIIPCIGPYVGDLVGSILCFVDCLVACQCWLFFTALCWIIYRPMIGIPLMLLACFLMGVTIKIRQDKGGPMPGGRINAPPARAAQPQMQMAQPSMQYAQQPQMQMAQPGMQYAQQPQMQYAQQPQMQYAQQPQMQYAQPGMQPMQMAQPVRR